MAWPEDSLSTDETIVTSFRPHWKLLFIPFLWFVALAVAAGFVVALFDGPVRLVFVAVFLVLAAILVVKPLVDWWWTRYVLTTERLITRTGLVAKTGVEIPLENITNVNFSQTFFERILGAGDLLVESAGTTGQSQFSNIPHPDDFQSVLYKTREARSLELSSGTRSAAAPRDHAEEIRKLAGLRDEGLISDEEYEAKRLEILDEM